MKGEKKNEAMQEMTQVQEEAYKSGSVQYIDSREVAEIVGKRHDNLKRDIAKYRTELAELNFEDSEFFIESVYKDSTGRKQKCYLVTKKGCEFIAHKLTGIKGTKFTATYINRFHEMESALEMRNASAALQQLMEQQTKMLCDISDRLAALEASREELAGLIVGPGAKPYTVDEDENTARKKKLNRLVTKMAKAYGWTRNFALHRLYKTMEDVLDISIDAYVDLYKEEMQRDACAIDAVVASERLYTTAIRLCNNTLSKMEVKP